MLDEKRILMMPKDSEFPFEKIHLDIIFCSHKTWKTNKDIIVKKTTNRPKIIFID
jgi:hypothetical protein